MSENGEIRDDGVPAPMLGMITAGGDDLTPEVMDQMNLALGDLKVCVDYTEKPKCYTAERVRRDRPDQYEAAIRFLANGFSFKRIVNRLNMDIRTVRAIHDSQTFQIDKQREILRGEFYPVVRMTLDQYVSEIPNMKGKDAAIGLGIVTDKYTQLSGLPTAKIEVNHHFDVGAELRKLNEEAREMIKNAKAHVVDPLTLGEGEASA